MPSLAREARQNICRDGKKIQMEIQNLSEKLKDLQHSSFYDGHDYDCLSRDQSFLRHQSTIENSRISQKPKSKIKWTASATIWTRDSSPSFAIPKAKRFESPKQNYSEFLSTYSPKIQSSWKKGVKFTQDPRHELFRITKTPSSQEYNCRRYLESSFKGRGQSVQSNRTLNPEETYVNHEVKGGAIGKFENHWALFYPHTDRRLHNQRILKEAEDSKKRERPYKIHRNPLRAG